MEKFKPYLTRLTIDRVCVAQGPNECIICDRLPACAMALPCGHCAMCVRPSVIA